jgi:hypothetical protein
MTRRALDRSCGSRRKAYLAIVLLTVTASAAVAAAKEGQTSEARQLSFKIDHFLCYRADPINPKLQRHPVVLKDQLAMRRGTAVGLLRLCNPAQKTSQGRTTSIRNPRAHLACYELTKVSPVLAQTKVAIQNQLEGPTRFALVKAVELCLPSGKSLVLRGTPPLARGLEHFECYTLKPTKIFSPITVTLRDQFDKKSWRARVLGWSRLCIPVSKRSGAKNTGAPVRNGHDHLLCYTISEQPGFEQRQVVINNQFKRATLTALGTESLCVPSVKRILSR